MNTQEQKPHVHGPDCQHDHHDSQALLCVMGLRWGVMNRVFAVAKKNIKNVVVNNFCYFYNK
ncbi:MAG: hypothetical protein ACJATV_000886 [Granulosicoccus sp.]|jgi:hypothetical protein